MKKLPTGGKLLDEISATPHRVSIYCGGEIDGVTKSGAAFAEDPLDFLQTIDRMAIPFTTLYNTLMTQRINRDQVKMDGLRDGLEGTDRQPVVDLLSATELSRVMLRASEKYRNPWITCANLTGIPLVDLCAKAVGTMPCSQDDYLKIALPFYELLSPGAGCSTQIRLEPGVGIPSTNHYSWLKNQHKEDETAVRKDIILGHELVHAWRMMTCRCLVDEGWEEEMMTVGFGACGQWPFTENSLRREAGHPIRLNYGLSAQTAYGTKLRSIRTETEYAVQQRHGNKVFGHVGDRSIQVINRDIDYLARNNAFRPVNV